MHALYERLCTVPLNRLPCYGTIEVIVTLLFTRPLGGSIKRRCCLASDVCLSVAYIGPKSRTERPRKTKIGIEVAHVTCGQGQKVKVTGGKAILWRPPARLVVVIIIINIPFGTLWVPKKWERWV